MDRSCSRTSLDSELLLVVLCTATDQVLTYLPSGSENPAIFKDQRLSILTLFIVYALPKHLEHSGLAKHGTHFAS